MCNIALILFLKCDVTTYMIPPPCHTKFWRVSTTLTSPRGSISTVCHRNRTSWEIIVGGAQYILKGLSALGRNDHPIKPKPRKPEM